MKGQHFEAAGRGRGAYFVLGSEVYVYMNAFMARKRVLDDRVSPFPGRPPS